ncbi:MAG: serine/threonine-protein kinase [Acidobacteriota bacterium]|nr:serine/threonine-protein kinase [Acidobacteriota bacterium]
MKSERYHQVSRLFESALALEEDARAAYLCEQCGTDEALREEVERLIASHREAVAQGFMASPAVERVAGVFSDSSDDGEDFRLKKGQLLGSYLILERLGAGGMGEVYLATDTRLDRRVALKILPQDFAADVRRMQRFALEAKVASTLNQPNILTVFEFGEVESLAFLATEYIDGETLRSYLQHTQPRLKEVLEISAQIVAALEAAHEARIVHRDIKPENVMIRRRDHIVKVLDFGLAKLTEKSDATESGLLTDTEAPTEFKTAPGNVLGTVAYMSPEQSQGLPVDERSDIWSTGIVIYEMVAGRVPFRGATGNHTIVEILEKEAPPLSQWAKQRVPDELERIVRKAIAKDRGERYQTASDLLIDLRNLKKRLEFESEIGRSTASEVATTSATTSDQQTKQSRETTAPVSKGKKVVAFAVAGLALIALATFALRGWLASRNSFVPAVAPSVTANSPERQLIYWITVQKYRDGKPFESPFRLASEINFERDYQVRLHLRSPQAGYLYILNESPTEDNPLQILFPSTTANAGSALLSKNQEIQIPEKSWFKFDGEQGTETLWLLWSNTPHAELEASAKFANTTERGVISDTSLSQSLKRLLSESPTNKLRVEKTATPPQTTLRSSESFIAHAIKLAHN